MKLLSFFDEYTSLGWEIIPIIPKSKIPFMKGWNVDYNKDYIRKYLSSHTEFNIGLRLGSVIDVEADTPQANKLLESLIPNDYEHPQYRSQKSVHHLFLTPSKSLTKVIIHGIEFRGHNHQSLLPPSITSGGEYTWIDNAQFSVPPLPDSLVKLYNRYTKKSDLKEPICNTCGKKSRPIHNKRYAKELLAFKSIGERWNCHKCRKSDVRAICRKITP